MELAPMATAIDPSQRAAAKVVGVTYLFAMAAAMFTEGYIRGTLVSADAVLTAQRIMANESLFRIGLGIEMIMFVSDTTLIAALFVILSPVNRHLAMHATLLRIAAVAVGLVMTAQGFEALRILGPTAYLGVFEADRLAAMARLSIGAHANQYGVVFIVLGLGSTVFAYLWLKSGYVPRALAILGIVASLMLAFGTLAFFVVPSTQRWISPYHVVPMFFFEVGMGFWLLIKGLPK